jgi:hypothetical protein
MQDRYRRFDDFLLRRTAGPYMWVIRVDFGLFARCPRFTR